MIAPEPPNAQTRTHVTLHMSISDKTFKDAHTLIMMLCVWLEVSIRGSLNILTHSDSY